MVKGIAIPLTPAMARVATYLFDLMLVLGVLGCLYLALFSGGTKPKFPPPDDAANAAGTAGYTEQRYGDVTSPEFMDRQSPKPNKVSPMDSERPATVFADKPEKALQGFYDALAAHNCDQAIAYRPDYSRSRCESVSKVKINKIRRVEENVVALAVFYLNVNVLFDDNTSGDFDGYVRLIRKQSDWIIDTGSYKSGLSQEDYLYTYGK